MLPLGEEEDRRMLRMMARAEVANVAIGALLVAAMLAACLLLAWQIQGLEALQAELRRRNAQGEQALALLAERNGQAARQVELLEAAVARLGEGSAPP